LLPGVSVFPGLLNWLYGSDKIQTIPELQSQFEQNGYMQWDSATGTAVPGNQLQTEFATQLSTVTDGMNVIPSTTISFWTFRLMIATGMLALLGGVVVLILFRGTHIPKPNPLWTAGAIVLPLLPLAANSFGWIFTEMGRQPWIVNGVMPTLYGLSPSVGVGPVWFSLIVYTLVYGVLAVVEVGLLLKYIKLGLPALEPITVKDEAEALSFAY
jgi:cytochrome d ubiquinol oxidase subunit I